MSTQSLFKNILDGTVSLIVAAGFLGCGNSGLPLFSKLDRLRILSIKASSPEAGVGETVTLQAVVADVPGLGGTLTYSAYACVDPGISLGATATCDGNATKTTLVSNQTFSLAAPHYVGELPSSLSVTLPAVALAGRKTFEQYNGISYLVFIEIQNSSGQSLKSFKRILVSTKAASLRNQNPSIGSVYLGSAPVGASTVSLGSSAPSSGQSLFIEPTGAQRFALMANTGSLLSEQTETLITSWFTSDGSYKREVTVGSGSNEYTPPTETITGHSNTWVIVARDQRGGEDYKIIKF